MKSLVGLGRFVFISLPTLATTLYVESLAAVGSLGDHFGIIGNASFDYVIVGGGTAGLALARRLSEDRDVSVAVVEAGSFYELDNGNRSTIPAFGSYGSGNNPSPGSINPRIDWLQYSEPQALLNNQPIFYPSGKTLGGGSARNYQAYHRATRKTYERWAQQVGDESYLFDNFLPFYQKSVHFTPPNNSVVTFNDSAFSSQGGPLEVSYASFYTPINPFILQAMQQAGLAKSADFSSGVLDGFGFAPVTQSPDLQERSSSESSYLREALQSSTNLAIFTNTLAKRVLFDDAKEATGVEVEIAGSRFVLSAKKETILSAGAMRSPQLLMVSGVGPRSILQQFGIPLIHEAPGVGQNLWDQPLFGPSYKVNVITHSALSDPLFAAEAVAEYNANRTGILTNGGGGILGFEKLPTDLRSNLKPSTREDFDTAFPDDWPEIEHITVDAWEGLQQDPLLDAPKDNANYLTISTGLLAPFSRGNVSLNSSDTAVNPLISPNWLEDPRDQEMAIQMYRRVRQIFSTEAMQPVLIGPEAFPGSNVTSDEQLLDVIKRSVSTLHHASATCAMGRSNDSMAVIDSHARVYGVTGLRVVDASSFPFLPPGHPQSTVYALAEKIAMDILSGN